MVTLYCSHSFHSISGKLTSVPFTNCCLPLPTIPGQNVDSMIFKEVMHELARKLGHLGKDFSDT